jgi:WD40 repeat protein
MAYILVTGWDQKVTLYVDEPTAITLEPISDWPATSGMKWHSDDILSLEYCAPDTIASSSYTGQIVFCSLQSGLIQHTFNPHDDRTADFPTQQRSIDRLLFLHSRYEQFPQAACLISCGGDGMIRFWRSSNAELFLEADCRPPGNKDGIYVLDTNLSNTLLFLADSAGMVHIHDIKDTGMTKSSDPKRMNPITSFQAHVHTITALTFVEDQNVIVTSSVDHTTRMFTVTHF